jgi:hypothetical protein
MSLNASWDEYEVNSGGIYTTPIKTSSSNLIIVDDTFTQNTNLLSLYKINWSYCV